MANRSVFATYVSSSLSIALLQSFNSSSFLASSSMFKSKCMMPQFMNSFFLLTSLSFSNKGQHNR